MAYDNATARRLRAHMSNRPDVREVKMMGALVFMVNGHMCCGVTGSDLMVRLGPDGAEKALQEPHVKPMEIGGGRTPRAFVCVEPAGFRSDEAFQGWIERANAFVSTLPPK